jgi:hypothetical protein
VQSTPNPPPAQQRDYLAEAVATADPDELAALVGAAKQAGAPGSYLACLDDIREAHQADDVAAVRKLYDACKDNDAPAEHLARIAHIGSTKPGAKAPQQDDQKAPPTTPSATPNADAERAAAEAEQRLRLAASRAGMQTLDADFERAYGMPIDQAPAQQLNAMAAMIEKAAQQ